jgi:hypothetical protein
LLGGKACGCEKRYDKNQVAHESSKGSDDSRAWEPRAAVPGWKAGADERVLRSTGKLTLCFSITYTNWSP